jgi:predicted TIM-barrel enzyme
VAVEFMRADAVIVTGSVTGEQPSDIHVSSVRRQSRLPLYLGSGITAENLPHYYQLADGFIVGTYLKKDGRWSEPVDPHRVDRLMNAHSAAAARNVTG